jgi:hypothetical protein
MALDSSALSRMMIDIFKSKSSAKIITKGVNVESTQLQDGTTKYDTTEIKGPMQINPDDVRPLFESIAEAIVQHLQQNAVVDNPLTTEAENWRIL